MFTLSLYSENSIHHAGKPLPVRGVLNQTFASFFCNGIKFGLAIVGRCSPLGGNPSTLLQPHKRRVDRPLVQQHFVAAHLLNPPGNAVAVERSHGCKRLQDHEVQSSLQQIKFGFGEDGLLCYKHRSISHVLWEYHRTRNGQPWSWQKQVLRAYYRQRNTYPLRPAPEPFIITKLT